MLTKVDQVIQSIDSFPLLSVERAVEKDSTLINENRSSLLQLSTALEEAYHTLTNHRDTKQRSMGELVQDRIKKNY